MVEEEAEVEETEGVIMQEEGKSREWCVTWTSCAGERTVEEGSAVEWGST
jgi:hypothetical protein